MDKTEEEELEPLFDYSRVQPINVICLDDDSDESTLPKKRKISEAASIIVDKGTKGPKVVNLVDENEEEDWLPPPPKVSDAAQNFEEDSTIKKLRLKKQELASFAQSAEELMRAVEESAQRDLKSSLHFPQESEVENASKLHDQRAKIIISIQDKDGQKQFRVFKDEKFEKIFKMYAEKVKRDTTSLVFSFDGDKVSPAATPGGLGMEDDDIIEVHAKSR
ncbi:uncharacterized protein LOC122081744 [Macadamia integrifolia]|uniref:uncharacterized protein LOC122081744 n=1 Tax=Macadamia integrifolia TaxID=60698 RepID=UPI001C4FEBB4|nr:uncharacterized protein LOC122081744 [Macadamia integrifolia]XP_042504912.1 uncharacterized protein LOC122081744 [Macadamia integrifolia]